MNRATALAGAAILLTAGCASTPPSDAQWAAITAMAAPLEMSLPGGYKVQTANPAAQQALATLNQTDTRTEWARIVVQGVLGGAQIWAGIQGGRDASRAATASSAAMWGGIAGIVGGVQGNTHTAITTSDSHNVTETGLDPTVVTQPAPLVVTQPEPVIVDPHVVVQTDRDHSSQTTTTQSPPVVVTQPNPVVVTQPEPIVVRPEVVNSPPAQIIYQNP